MCISHIGVEAGYHSPTSKHPPLLLRRYMHPLATINHSTRTILLFSSSNISSIGAALVHQLGLSTSTAPSIQVFFGDHQHLYHSRTQAHCIVTLGNLTFSHQFYVLIHQLFPPHLTLWLVPQASHYNLFHSPPTSCPTSSPNPLPTR